MADDLFKSYFDELADVAGRGDAREESYYPALKTLLESFAYETDRDDAAVTVLPAQTEAGSPDVRVWDGEQHVTGYVEAKRPGTDLDEVAQTEQLERYRSGFPNLVLTDFCEFRLYREGDLKLTAQAIQPSDLRESKSSLFAVEESETKEVLEAFFQFSIPRSYDAESLATELAKRTRLLRDVVLQQLKWELEVDKGRLPGFYEAFQEYLIAGLEPLDFADLYAQTLTYGLFAARVRAEDDEFTRTTAVEHIPRSIGVLHEIFEFISYQDVPEALAWIVDDISEVLAVADAGGILDRYYQEGKGTDPVIHFYETFLAIYDPEERERRGVYYTPEPVVGYIVRSLHKILKDEFGKADGLASDGVTLLDPAAGTMTFVARATREAAEEFAGKYGEGAVEGFLTDHVLENFYAFELMMAPYAVGHLKMSFLLEEMGHRIEEDERFQLYLTNTLEMEELDQTKLPGLKPLAEESHLAGAVKKETPIWAILGNPPYSRDSANKGKWIGRLIDDYKEVDGEAVVEQQIRNIRDDYVKFLRFAQWKIDQEGEGVVGMITNHSWFDNVTFRGMRWNLLQSFDEIRVLDLHGNSLKKERTPEGGPDENVFDIRQGVAISFFIKRQKSVQSSATVYHADRWGTREDKYNWLEEHDVFSTDWQKITPKSEFYLYVPRDEVAREHFNEFPKVTNLFPVHSVGIYTGRDGFVVDVDREALEERIQMFRDPASSDEEVAEVYDLRSKDDWPLSEKRQRIQEDDEWREKITKIQYRAFDERWIFYHYHAVDRGLEEVMRHMIAEDNLCLLTTRQVSRLPWQHVLCSSSLVDNCTLSTRTKERGYAFPLYLYPNKSKRGLFSHLDEAEERRPNLDRRVLPDLASAYGHRPSPEAIFYYVYAVLHAQAYRNKYAAFLKIDFPRVPFAKDYDLFSEYADLGYRLIKLHQLESMALEDPVVHFHGKGDNEVVRRKSQGFRYDPETERKHINEDQYFAPLPRPLWEYQVGGYQVLRKWLKDRKERKLSSDEIRTYCRVVTALQKTIEIQEEIDALYPEAEADVVDLNLAD